MKNLQKELRPKLEVEYSKKWTRRDGTANTKMVDYSIKEYLHIEYQGKLIDVCKAKPSIRSEFWFDDEKPIPKRSYEIFKSGNMRNLSEAFTSRKYQKDLVLVKTDNANLYTPNYVDIENFKYPYELVSDDLLEKMNEVITYRNNDFEKRLETYWKRYSDKVRNRGYWVNR